MSDLNKNVGPAFGGGSLPDPSPRDPHFRYYGPRHDYPRDKNAAAQADRERQEKYPNARPANTPLAPPVPETVEAMAIREGVPVTFMRRLLAAEARVAELEARLSTRAVSRRECAVMPAPTPTAAMPVGSPIPVAK